MMLSPHGRLLRATGNPSPQFLLLSPFGCGTLLMCRLPELHLPATSARSSSHFYQGRDLVRCTRQAAHKRWIGDRGGRCDFLAGGPPTLALQRRWSPISSLRSDFHFIIFGDVASSHAVALTTKQAHSTTGCGIPARNCSLTFLVRSAAYLVPSAGDTPYSLKLGVDADRGYSFGLKSAASFGGPASFFRSTRTRLSFMSSIWG